MKPGLSSTCRRCLELALCTVLIAGAPASADESKDKNKSAPVRLSPDKLAGLDLPAEEAFIAPKDILDGTHKPRGEVLFMGEQLVLEVYEDEPATFAMSEPTTLDEYIQILSGKLILTDAKGQTLEFTPGDSLVLPKGFTGTWKMLGNFRELVAIERKAYDKAYGAAAE